MSDIKTQSERSKNMAAIHSKDTEPEKYIRSLLFQRGYRFRKNCSALPGRPDIWLKKYNTAIFVNGCFWHRHKNCKYAYSPKTRVLFWESKFEANKNRDSRTYKTLKNKGIKCLIIWECLIKKMRTNEELRDRVVKKIELFMSSEETFGELE